MPPPRSALALPCVCLVCLLEPRRRGHPKKIGEMEQPNASAAAAWGWEPAPVVGEGRGLLSLLIPVTLEGRLLRGFLTQKIVELLLEWLLLC